MPNFQAIRPPSISDINPKLREEWSEFLTDDRSPSLSDINPNTLGEEVTLDKQLENNTKKTHTIIEKRYQMLRLYLLLL